MIRFSWPVLLAGALLALSCQKEPARELPEPEKPVVMDGSHKGPAAVFIGDSITQLWGQEKTGHPEFFSKNNYVNKGISGNKTTVERMPCRQRIVTNEQLLNHRLVSVDDCRFDTGVRLLWQHVEER